MSDLFISYKREDQTRVARLVNALQTLNLAIWWDQTLPAGENWRTRIQTELDAARCVIVVWTRHSTGPEGDFVREEATQAKRRGILVPIRLDLVDPPLGFAEIQTIDLARWSGSPRDPFFQDITAAIAAKLEGRPVPPAKAPARRLMRRLTYSSLAAGTAVMALAFALNLLSIQDRACALPLLQPGLSDACGTLGLGHRPTYDERIAWESRQPGDCLALRTHIERFPQGVYRAEAASLLAARRVAQTEVWAPSTRRLALFEPQQAAASPNEAAAREAALSHSQRKAGQLCEDFAASQSFRFRKAAPAPRTWDCGKLREGVTCGFSGEAVCSLDERTVQEIETCGK